MRRWSKFAWLGLTALSVSGCAAASGAGGGGPSGPTPVAVNGLAITDIAVFQGPKVPIVAGFAHKSHAVPVVAGRPGILRVYYAPATGWTPIEITATLTINNGGTLTNVPLTLTPNATPSAEADLKSTINFDLPTDAIKPGATFGVTLTTIATQAAGDSSRSSWPAPGTPPNVDGTPVLDDLGVRSSGEQLKVKIVPVKYMADGSGRLPDTSPAQIEVYRKKFMAWYPAKTVDISVRAPWTYNSGISQNGGGWSQALMAAQQLRQTDGAPNDVYYYAAFAPGDSFDSWCNPGCVAGLSGLDTSPTDAFQRSSIGLGWTGDASAETAAHEVGHAHGRQHAPCGGAASPDPAFPYAQGAMTTWGYDVLAKTLVDPKGARIDSLNGDPLVIDYMGYATDPMNQTVWSSDYTYGALFTRIAAVNGAAQIIGAREQELRMILVDADGVHMGGTLRAETLEAADRTVRWISADGASYEAKGRWVPFDHIDGGILYVPESPFAIDHAELLHPLTGRVTTIASH